MKKMTYWLMVGAMAATLLTGCKGSSATGPDFTVPNTQAPQNDYTFLASTSCVFVQRNGQVVSADVEDFSKDYYDVDELKTKKVEPAIAAYNKEAGEGAVTLNALTVKDGMVTMELKFATGDDYVKFNRETNHYFSQWQVLKVCKYSELPSMGYALTGDLVLPDGTTCGAATITGTENLNVCVIDMGTEYPTGFNGTFLFEGDVAYMSPGITKGTSANSVVLANTAGLQFVLFK